MSRIVKSLFSCNLLKKSNLSKSFLKLNVPIKNFNLKSSGNINLYHIQTKLIKATKFTPILFAMPDNLEKIGLVAICLISGIILSKILTRFLKIIIMLALSVGIGGLLYKFMTKTDEEKRPKE